MDCTFPTPTEEGFVGSNAWLDLLFRSRRVQRLVALHADVDKLEVTCIQNTGEALLAEGRDKVQRHRLLIFYIDARQIKIKWSANMYALRIVNSKGDFASRLERWPSPYAVQQPQKKGNL